MRGDPKPTSAIPLPNHLDISSGEGFDIDRLTRVVANPSVRGALEPFLTRLRTATGHPLEYSSAADGDNVLEFRIDAEANYLAGGRNPEAYRIEITPAAVRVRAASDHGLFNATQTLRQLLPAAIEADGVLADWTLPGGTIVDWPQYGYRGLMIDVARSFLTVEEMKQIIDAAAWVKISRLHLHLSDDQGWRIEITNDGRAEGDTIDYSLLTRVSGATAMTERGYDGEPGRTGFYTQGDYREIVAYAHARHITVIPEIDLPGHTIGALAAIPELNTPGSSHPATAEDPTCPPNGTADVGHSYLDPHSEHTYTFARHVLRQLARITPGEYLHIGGDEPLKMTERYGQEVYLDCVGRIASIVREVGKKPAGWNELAEAAPGADMIVQFWQGESTHTVQAAEAGAKILLSRGESVYLDQKYHPEFPLGLDWACTGDCDFPVYYSWEPARLIPELTPDQIAGVEAPLWSETLRGVNQVLLMVFPRLFATAELGWSTPRTRDLEKFTQRLAAVAPRLLLSGGNFYDGEKAAWRPVLAGHRVTGQGPVATVAVPGGGDPRVSVEIDGAQVPARLETVIPRGPLQAGPVVEVCVDGVVGQGRVNVDGESVPFTIG